MEITATKSKGSKCFSFYLLLLPKCSKAQRAAESFVDEMERFPAFCGNILGLLCVFEIEQGLFSFLCCPAE